MSLIFSLCVSLFRHVEFFYLITTAVKQHSTHSGFPNQAKRQRIHYMDRKKVRSSFGIKSSHSRTFSSHKKPVYVNASTNTSFPGCSGNSCPYHSENPRLWTIEDVGEYIRSTDCKNYASYFMDQVWYLGVLFFVSLLILLGLVCTSNFYVTIFI